MLETGQPKLAFIVSIVAGATIWVGLSLWTGVSEAWDDQLYWIAAYPAFVLISGIAGYLAPEKPWRWPMTLMLAQLAVLVVQKGMGNLLPIGAIVFLVLALPLLAPAYLGAWIVRRTRT